MNSVHAALLFLFWPIALTTQAQLLTGNIDLTIQTGAVITINGLSLAPSQDLVLKNNSLIHSDVAIVGKPTNSINRVYKFSNQINFTGKIGMQYAPSELNGNDESLLQFSFAKEDLIYSVPTNLSAVNVNTHYLEEIVASKEMVVVTATESGSILPVKLIDFVAIGNEDRALLTWSTSEESNSDHFEIQHSANGKTWKEIGHVDASGESKMRTNYAFEHRNPLKGENLYRLKMMDKDGSYAYSRVREVHLKGNYDLTFHPNPVQDWVSIESADWASFKSMSVTSSNGKTFVEVSEPQKKINLQELPAGVYLISITQKDGSVKSGKIFKN
ncbi:T9SS type A sorting domain-containing protein [Dyadobacter sp. CY326]|uniref:T9SS type A sorting domain-containing protein n=1 Tax=Dyadobacter sp. CY326 TaxID=2907300 RepID=UPI001F3A88AC|nr:T9SS type A sorting domain-containing protein [Dyadobacter sp. CY326]MCE7065314.1 T9SS type A sorting domain-containing protein [Dyadobacter sp. CY326]